MARLHLFEFNDQAWLPEPIRAGMRDYLSTISRLARLHEHLAPHLDRALEDSGAEQIVDLCSGSGGPLLHLQAAVEAEIGEPIDLVLTGITSQLLNRFYDVGCT